jgi:hypothetical protein
MSRHHVVLDPNLRLRCLVEVTQEAIRTGASSKAKNGDIAKLLHRGTQPVDPLNRSLVGAPPPPVADSNDRSTPTKREGRSLPRER